MGRSPFTAATTLNVSRDTFGAWAAKECEASLERESAADSVGEHLSGERIDTGRWERKLKASFFVCATLFARLITGFCEFLSSHLRLDARMCAS